MRRCTLGPLLGYHGDGLRSVTIVQELSPGESLELSWGFGENRASTQFESIGEFEPGKSRVFRADFEPGTEADRKTVFYQIFLQTREGRLELEPAWGPGTRRFEFQHCHKLSQMKILFGSCMDRESPKDRDNRFLDHLSSSERSTHLFLLGGDQIYTDGYIGSIVERLEPSPVEIQAGIRQAYLDGWNRPPVGQLLSSIPNAMMWDDHDIFDGYGSYMNRPKAVQDYLATFVFPHAARYFELLQLRRSPAGGDLSWVVSDTDTVVAALDARSSRDARKKRVLDPIGFAAFERTILDHLERSTDPTLVMVIPIPLVHLRYGEPNWLLRNLRRLGAGFVDDLIDNWSSARNLEEERLLIGTLQRLRPKVRRMILLSGDSHMGSAGVLRFDTGSKAYQITSSGTENTTGLSSWGITGPGGKVPRDDDRKRHQGEGPSFLPVPGTSASMGMVPVEGNDEGFLSAKSPYLDHDYFTKSRNAVVLDLAGGPSVRWILEGSPKNAPRRPWAIP